MLERFAIAVDIGGTFTDFVLLDRSTNSIITTKVLTTPSHPEMAILQGVDQLSKLVGLDLKSADLFLHATTIITNAVIERKVNDAIMLHTEGFRDLLEIGREHRYNLTNLKIQFPEPLSRRDLRVAIDERTDALGNVVSRPDKVAVCAQLNGLADRKAVQSFAICFLHSYKNPANEHLVRDWILELYPDAYVSCSSSVAPSQREYERWTTCTINASTMPLLADYVGRLKLALIAQGFTGRALMMTSSGLPLEFSQCVGYPIRMIESGPAAGVLAANELVSRVRKTTIGRGLGSNLKNLLAYDMGGTTAKGAFIIDGAFHVKKSLEVARVGAFEAGSGLPLMIPAIDLIEIGAGGGSIATVDDRGLLAVGPQSAGADPGPACYGRGGQLPTLTDANLALGYLSEENFAKSGFVLRRDCAYSSLEGLARRLSTAVERVAHGIRNTVNESVARAFRVHASEQGLDYRNCALVCTGGAAPLQAAEIARILNISTVIFPFSAGVSSAFGLFTAHEGITLQKTNTITLAELSRDRIARETSAIIERDANALALSRADARCRLTLGMRYKGQGFEVDVEIEEFNSADEYVVKSAFEKEYRRIFGVTFPGYAIEVFNWTLQITLPRRLCDLAEFRYANAATRTEKIRANRPVLGNSSDEVERIPVYDRYALRPGDVIEGRSLIEEDDTTIFLPAFVRGCVTESFDIVAELAPNRN